ncbi:diacylglycerol kinase catalytic domain-containing transcriptional regulator [Citrobacter freundii ATCC 8090 = MTCC 1658 = NBRC 12681]|uniref:lipid kinase YegS n=1 Tax=Citrobacter freundii TaxID=546 RepID=UPI000299BEA1|nr:lipid kinase YegS [Citrobacter freundii]EKS55827.1 lipid kinase [Citrobacter freundii ATCC 8090 = MTCC 1658 = NBRC 12681]ELK6447797.1 lipid kinase YegS [Citrobacter freundii]EXF29390.1 lipid kinase [Citrobacter freundii RLS1]KFB99436.1 diacylglycerol kinase catalytic domain-containing transcriptional regulator [Citrobacter freundii ATCC 8090 = MTCC 1658 = NBRC 12681]QIH69777.1 lipid kinase YegS [Citrobacter freundii ATCC 8090 = MTCC 1658 = NBRC 12681]
MIAFPASLLILNGKSADNLPLRDAIAKLRDEGVEIHVRVTWEKGDAQRYVNEARQLGVETVIAGGGDGTINEVSTALIQSQGGNIPALGILPLGTANDFATSVGIPDDLDKALKLAIAANATAIDMVQVNDKTCFINMATGGFGTRITTETPEKLKAALGGVSYFIHGLMRMDTLKPDVCDIRGEDFHWQGKALVIGIGNGRQAGGGQQLCPTALINDGLLQLRIFTGEELLPGLLSALTQSEDNPNIIEGASSWFDIRAPHEITFNLDGEPLSGQEFHIEILPEALRCRLPPGCPLLR